NCRYNKAGYAAIYGKVGEDREGVPADMSGFAIFSTQALGWQYLENLITKIAKDESAHWMAVAKEKFDLPSSELTIAQFFTIYSPTDDQNDPVAYAKWIGDRLGVDYQHFKIKELL